MTLQRASTCPGSGLRRFEVCMSQAMVMTLDALGFEGGVALRPARSAVRAVSATFGTHLAQGSAICNPSPREPPVIRATRAFQFEQLANAHEEKTHPVCAVKHRDRSPQNQAACIS